ncbi:tail fiber domain-containing protein [Psychroserpens sp. SPM9]|uniref:tail fiber domain-containing protein n=1 Tax=Psychroserpens sp. SPM9 TaxID=2975598 RepID=UPI0021A33520|nr:tail fiber domain-containing protein [Psychroserpens sp. SPM9]MDG5491223.1 tail fiber domain-containing protein [Psychroserpens sp. SPM9]
MKTLLTILMAMLFTSLSFAQQGINYKAVIKDNLGNVVTNTTIGVQFRILQGAGQVNVYEETHSPTTDANGMIILNIGLGTTSDVFTDIDWANDEHFLNVQVNLGFGIVDMGTTPFKTVPYAINAENVRGLEILDEGNGFGWRLKGRDPAFYGNIGLEATDLSYSNENTNILGALGSYSVAMGYNSTASGNGSIVSGFSTNASGAGSVAMGSFSAATGIYSTAFGYNSTASGDTSLAIGSNTMASGSRSIAMGFDTVASGLNATAFGNGTTASGAGAFAIGAFTTAPSILETVIGRFNTSYTPISAVDWFSTDRLFVIGNGTSTTPSNALTVLKNGTITAPSFDLAEITDDKALTTKEYVDQNAASGLEALDEGNGIGWRLIGRNPSYYGNIGLRAVDFSFNSQESGTYGAIGTSSVSMGTETLAIGNRSTAMGYNTEASGYTSTAIGAHTLAIGDYSNVIGFGSAAIGDYATAIGVDARAEGDFSTALGFGPTALSYGEIAIGRLNTIYTPNNAIDWDSADRLFVIGNGTNVVNRSNALTVLKNGNTGIGTATPDYKLEVSGTTNINEGVSSGIALRVNGDEALWYNGNYFSWGYGTGTGYNFFATNVGLGMYNPNVRLDVNGSIEYTGTITDVSDRRLKEHFKSIENPLDKIKQITGLSYNMIDDEDKKREYGVIAQDVQKMFPEMVSVVDEEHGYLGVSYIQLIPVLLEALKEQQKIIENQNSKLDMLSAQVDQIETLKSRLSQIEQLLNTEK